MPENFDSRLTPSGIVLKLLLSGSIFLLFQGNPIDQLQYNNSFVPETCLQVGFGQSCYWHLLGL